MTTKRKQDNSKETEKSYLKCEELEKALDSLHDMFDRAFVPFMLLGETAHSVFYSEGLEHCPIEIGVKPRHLTEYAFSTLKSLIPSFGTAPEPAGFTIDNVPFKMYILRKDSDVFQRPDMKFYDRECYFIPNPFVKYYKNRSFFE